MKALVTGGAGFIGHHLVAELLRRDDDVVVIDNFLTGSRARLAAIENRITVHEGDIRDPEAVMRASEGVDIVFHLAALPSVQRSVDDPSTTNDINVGGTISVMRAAAQAGVGRVVLSGSSSIYGSSPELPRRETQRPDPRSPYAVSKLAAEGYVLAMGAITEVEAVVLRYFNVFGPGQDPASMYAAVVPRFITAALRDESPTIFGDGKQSRDFTYVDNVVQANLRAAEAPGVDGRTFNVGCGERYTLLQLVEAIERAAGVTLTPIFEPALPGDVRDSEADITLAARELGYQPTVSFREGIARTVAAYASERAAPSS